MFPALRHIPSMIHPHLYFPQTPSTIPAISLADSFQTATRKLTNNPEQLHLFDVTLAKQSHSITQMLFFFAQFESSPGNFVFPVSEVEESFALVDILAGTYSEKLVSLVEKEMLAIADDQMPDFSLGHFNSPREVIGGVLFTQKAAAHYVKTKPKEPIDLALSNLFRAFQNTTLGMNKLYGLIQNEEYDLDWPRNYLTERCQKPHP